MSMLRIRGSNRRAPRAASSCGGNRARPLRLFVSLALAASVGGCAIAANERQQALDGYAKQWSGILEEGLVKETATTVAPTPGYAPGDVFTSYADGPAHVGCSVPRHLIRPDVHFSMSPPPAGGAAGMGTATHEAIDVAFDDARETDVSPSQFLQWLAGDEECRKAVNARLGSGPVRLVLGVVSAKAKFSRRLGADGSLAGAGHGLDPGGDETDAAPRQYFLILYTVTRPISPLLAERASSTAPARPSVARAEPQAAPPKATGQSRSVAVQAAAGALPATAPQSQEQRPCGHDGLACGAPRAPATSGPVSPEAPGAAATEAAAPPELPTRLAAAAQSASLDRGLPRTGGESQIPLSPTSVGAVSGGGRAAPVTAGGVRSCEDQFNQAQMLFGYSHFDRAAEAYESAYHCAPRGEHAPLALLNLAYSDDALNRIPDMCAAIAALDRNFHDAASSITERAGELARIGHCRQIGPGE